MVASKEVYQRDEIAGPPSTKGLPLRDIGDIEGFVHFLLVWLAIIITDVCSESYVTPFSEAGP